MSFQSRLEWSSGCSLAGEGLWDINNLVGVSTLGSSIRSNGPNGVE